MDTGQAILFPETNGAKNSFKRIPFGSAKYDEKWLQQKIYENIELLNVTDPTYDRISIVPLCCEFSMHDTLRNVFLDILAVTETGKLVLVECKLWKNPQARREVLAQIIEYATLLQSLSYSDLTARLHRYMDASSGDPIVQRFRSLGLEVDEGLLIDRIAQSLRFGKFQMIIAGDGIRSDVMNIANSKMLSGIQSDLCLLEVAIYENNGGDVILIPSVPVKTETINKTVLISPEGLPATIEDEPDEVNLSGTTRQVNQVAKEANTLFWNKMIESMEFDHPDQEPARRGGNNWIKIPLTEPFKWITAWRSKNQFGVFVRVPIEIADPIHEFFKEHLNVLETEIDPKVRLEYNDGASDWSRGFFISLRVDDVDTTDTKNDQMQINWFKDRLNKFVNSLRPLTRQYKATV